MSGIMLRTMDKELYVCDQGAHNLGGEEGVDGELERQDNR